MNGKMKNLSKRLNSKKFRYGGVSILFTIGFIAIIMLVNIGLTSLEEVLPMQLDMTQNELYTLSDQTKATLDSLDKDVVIYTTFSSGESDVNVVELLKTYSSSCKHISVVSADPDTNPVLFQPYLNENGKITNGTVIVSLAEDTTQFRTLNTTDIYSYKMDTEENTYVKDQFVMESSLTTALEYLNIGYTPRIYFLEGHGERDFKDDETLKYLSDQMINDNFSVEMLSLKENPDQLQDGDIVFIVGPTMDIDSSEREILRDLFDRGGRIVMVLDPLTMAEGSDAFTQAEGFTNLKSLLTLYGLSLDSGLVMDESSSFYYGAYNYLVPALNEHKITSTLRTYNYRPIFPNAGSIHIADVLPDADLTVTPISITSEDAWLQSDITDADIYTKGENVQEGPFYTAVAVEKVPSENEKDIAKLLVVYSTDYADYQKVGSVSNTGTYINMELLMDACAWMKDSDKEIYIRGKSLFESSLIFDSMLQIYTVLIAVCVLVPLVILIMGVVVWMRRKNL